MITADFLIIFYGINYWLKICIIYKQKNHIQGSQKFKHKLVFYKRIRLKYNEANQMRYYPCWKTPCPPQNTYR
uniref:Uncharacterized protein n=1 Tax=Arundo donax TaxID=35708 RepID=A0A0A9FD27_ARUDO